MPDSARFPQSSADSEEMTGRIAGVVSDERWTKFQEVREELAKAETILKADPKSPHVRLPPTHFFPLFLIPETGMGEVRSDCPARWSTEKVVSST